MLLYLSLFRVNSVFMGSSESSFKGQTQSSEILKFGSIRFNQTFKFCSYLQLSSVLQSALECCRLLQSIPECFRVFQSAPECSKVLQSAPECSRDRESRDERNGVTGDNFLVTVPERGGMSWMVSPLVW